MEWLEEEAKGLAIIGYIILSGLMIVSLQQMVYAMLSNWGIILSSHTTSNPFELTSKYMLIELFLISPIFEELFFRIAPLSIIISFVSKSPKTILGWSTFFAILFGFMHPYQFSSRIGVAIGGFFFGLLFLKSGGLEKKFIKAGLTVIAAHGTTNFLILLYGFWEHLITTAN